MSALVRSAEEVIAWVVAGFAELREEDLCVEELSPTFLRLRLTPGPAHIRPGGTISGPTLVTLADLGLYMLLLARGAPPGCVTSTLTAHFLARPQPGPLVAEVRLLKHSRRSATAAITVHAEGGADPVAHITATYAIPSG